MKLNIVQAGALGIVAAICLVAGCGLTSVPTNPFIDYTETFGAAAGLDANSPPGSRGDESSERFRDSITLTLVNAADVDDVGDAELRVALAAWVEVSSVRNAQQADALISEGFVQLGRQVDLGVYALPPGTYVRNGPGVAGAQLLLIPPGESLDITLVTPDTLLLFLSPPDSCESEGFIFTIDGFPIRDQPPEADGAGALIDADGSSTGELGIKTLSMYDVYQCSDPNNSDTAKRGFRPGLFLKVGGGSKAPNEYFEGEDITITFSSRTDENNVAATVEIGG